MTAAAIFGAGGGIGRALVERLSAGGQFDTIHAGARRALGHADPRVRPFAFDLEDEATIETAVTALDPVPALTLVTTGVLHDPARGIAPEKTLRAIDGAAMARVVAINTIGPALIARHLLPRLPRDRRAIFAVLSARVGSIGDNRLGGWHAYRASKAALNMLVVDFAIELRRTHPQAIVVALHPGTVETGLSAPFRGGVGPDRLFTPAVAAGHLLHVIESLRPEHSGGFYAWDGSAIPW